MRIKFKDIYINYEILGSVGEWIVFLHGWGGNTKSFEVVAKEFISTNRCLLIDFPPFGQSEEPYEEWNVDTYNELVKEILKTLDIKRCSVIAHSFGGRVAIKLSNSYNNIVEKLILVDSAGLKPRFSIKKYINKKRYQLAKRFKKDTSKFGSSDYKALSPLMRKTFVKVINEDLTKDLKLISCPTLIIFGQNDKDTPLYMAKKFNKKIKNSAIIVFKSCGHFSYIEDFNKFVVIAKQFLKG